MNRKKKLKKFHQSRSKNKLPHVSYIADQNLKPEYKY